MITVGKKGNTNDYVYDISLDGTVVNALGCNIASNTDGFNFQLPETYRYTEENPYISSGLSRETKEGKTYTGYQADVAEFNDIYMSDKHYSPKSVNKMGLGIDEVLSSTINFSRKNYADWFPHKPYPEDVKLVGNTVKSKKMPEYIAKFLAKGIRLLLSNKGQEFLDEYYDYVEKIYNYRIPYKDIATKGKVKKTKEEYLKDCNTLTSAGNFKSRQAWMELAIRDNIKFDIGDTIYYVNTGEKKSQGDCKRETKYFIIENDEKIDITKTIDKKWKEDKALSQWKGKNKSDYIKETFSKSFREDVIYLNCKRLPIEIVESEEDIYEIEGIEYNVERYLDMFNKRITPLLVCFSKDIRDRILITNPSERQFFTEKESQLVNSVPNKPTDQDTYEDLMEMDEKEILFWAAHPEFKVPFLEECGLSWDTIFNNYVNKIETEKSQGIYTIKEKFKTIVNKLTKEECNSFIDDLIIPSELSKIVEFSEIHNCFVSPNFPHNCIGTVLDILDRSTYLEENALEQNDDEILLDAI